MQIKFYTALVNAKIASSIVSKSTIDMDKEIKKHQNKTWLKSKAKNALKLSVS